MNKYCVCVEEESQCWMGTAPDPRGPTGTLWAMWSLGFHAPLLQEEAYVSPWESALAPGNKQDGVV